MADPGNTVYKSINRSGTHELWKLCNSQKRETQIFLTVKDSESKFRIFVTFLALAVSKVKFNFQNLQTCEQRAQMC
jgi:hypothetical protein